MWRRRGREEKREERKKREEREGRKKEKEIKENPRLCSSKSDFVVCLYFWGKMLNLEAPYWCYFVANACIVKLGYDLCLFWGSWSWYVGSISMILLRLGFSRLGFLVSSFLHACFDDLVYVFGRKFLLESCRYMSLVSPVKISASLEL